MSNILKIKDRQVFTVGIDPATKEGDYGAMCIARLVTESGRQHGRSALMTKYQTDAIRNAIMPQKEKRPMRTRLLRTLAHLKEAAAHVKAAEKQLNASYADYETRQAITPVSLAIISAVQKIGAAYAKAVYEAVTSATDADLPK